MSVNLFSPKRNYHLPVRSLVVFFLSFFPSCVSLAEKLKSEKKKKYYEKNE